MLYHIIIGIIPILYAFGYNMEGTTGVEPAFSAPLRLTVSKTDTAMYPVVPRVGLEPTTYRVKTCSPST